MAQEDHPAKSIDVVVVAIGRNEGERLRVCLQSLVPYAATVVYVDSGSTDQSVAMARALGVEVVELDMRQPFTAARARNAGFAAAMLANPQARYVQFVDGDTEVAPGWLEAAQAFLETNPAAAAVIGRRRERFPSASVYNLLCDLEWTIPPGPVKYCGGDVLMRRDAFEGIGGYNGDIIAAEDSELALRLRQAGWTLHCIAAEMTMHDAAIKTFRQWWIRMMRGGFGFAEGQFRHGASPERHFVTETRRIVVWGLMLPIGIAVLVLVFGPMLLLSLLVYPLQVIRLYFKFKGSPRLRWIQAWYLTLARFPETVGLTKFYYRRMMGRAAAIIEYK